MEWLAAGLAVQHLAVAGRPAQQAQLGKIDLGTNKHVKTLSKYVFFGKYSNFKGEDVIFVGWEMVLKLYSF